MNLSSARLALALAALSAAWSGAAGCAPSSAAFCNDICACKECSEPELETCIGSLQQARRSAENRECSADLDRALSCVSGNLTCTANRPSAEGCDDEAEALSACGAFVPPGLGIDACAGSYARLRDKYEACGIFIEPQGPIQCDVTTAQALACYLPCVEAATCEGLLGTDPNASAEYSNCIDDCSL